MTLYNTVHKNVSSHQRLSEEQSKNEFIVNVLLWFEDYKVNNDELVHRYLWIETTSFLSWVKQMNQPAVWTSNDLLTTNYLISSFSFCAPSSKVIHHTEFLLSGPSLPHDYLNINLIIIKGKAVL